MKFRLSSINMNSWMMQLNSSKAKTKDNKVSTSRAMQKEEDKAKAFKELANRNVSSEPAIKFIDKRLANVSLR